MFSKTYFLAHLITTTLFRQGKIQHPDNRAISELNLSLQMAGVNQQWEMQHAEFSLKG